jgi:hypothetical protein
VFAISDQRRWKIQSCAVRQLSQTASARLHAERSASETRRAMRFRPVLHAETHTCSRSREHARLRRVYARESPRVTRYEPPHDFGADAMSLPPSPPDVKIE